MSLAYYTILWFGWRYDDSNIPCDMPHVTILWFYIIVTNTQSNFMIISELMFKYYERSLWSNLYMNMPYVRFCGCSIDNNLRSSCLFAEFYLNGPLSFMFNSVAIDGLATQGARASTTTLLKTVKVEDLICLLISRFCIRNTHDWCVISLQWL